MARLSARARAARHRDTHEGHLRASEYVGGRDQMTFASSPGLRAEIIVACRVLDHFRIVEGFGHVSARVEGSDRIVITPRRALALVAERDLVEVDYDGRRIAGAADPPLEAPMHL